VPEKQSCLVLIALLCLSPAISGNTHAGSGSFSSSQARGAIADASLADVVQRLQASAFLSPEIQFDARGAEFGPWIRRFIMQTKRNWFVPYGVMSLNGHVVITFNVHKDGSLTDATVTGPSPVEEFNHAAIGAIAVSSPTLPLPAAYPDDKAHFTVTFFHNEAPPGGSLPPRPAAASWPPPGIYVAGTEGVTPPRVLEKENPSYTPAATRAKIEGSVLLEGIVQPDGTFKFVHVVRSLDPTDGLDQEALKAAARWRFTPGKRMGAPVGVVVTIETEFHLKAPSP
jgi:TonB family protein